MKQALKFALAWGGFVAIIMAGVILLAGCAMAPPLTSAVGGWYTHDRIDRLEVGRIEKLEERVGKMEEKP